MCTKYKYTYKYIGKKLTLNHISMYQKMCDMPLEMFALAVKSM